MKANNQLRCDVHKYNERGSTFISSTFTFNSKDGFFKTLKNFFWLYRYIKKYL